MRHVTRAFGTICFLEADFKSERLWSTKEGVGETSGQTAGFAFSKSSLLENRSGRRNRFSSFGADLDVRNFTGASLPGEIWS